MKEPLHFGAQEWKKHFGIEVTEPMIPSTIKEILENKCPFWPDKHIKESHFLCLIPNDLTLQKLCELTQCLSRSSLSTETTDLHWILITRKIIPTTSEQSFSTVEKIVSERGYKIPTLLEAATAVLAAKSLQVALFPSREDFTACQEKYNGTHVLVGYDSIAPCSIYVNNLGDIAGAAGVWY